MEQFFLILEAIKIKPGLHIGRKSLTKLAGFIDGFLIERPFSAEAYNFLARFRVWLGRKYHITSSHHWSDIIVFFAGDESAAFDKFYSLLSEFIALDSSATSESKAQH